MMTFEEQMTRSSSTHRMAMAALDKYGELCDAWYKLVVDNTPLELPKSFRVAIEARAARLRQEMDMAIDLYKAWNSVYETILARPYCSYVRDTKLELIGEGRLPNGNHTSKDETEALKMLADYYARESA